ncbi:sugar phosphate isomerase/epimerase [Silvibacterium bohemicum]|uniref:Sugar phosphate isomerase/epimerase n=1 Tax=Silvibacterium bohemicum TaxID=1577686 RepID=A0A841JRM7_9BACT|nr:sugar phosphate isomerase/epimerase [Silvibacterium bohemicum]MBB6143177.1 sugar phosphate isomerase/epimerase [Silvibacterium bohemicum]
MPLLSRRSFLRNSSAAAALLTSTFSRSALAKAGRQPVGIQLYTVGDELKQDVPGALKKIREIGYREVETAGFAGLTGAEFRKQLDAAGLVCHSAHLQMNTSDLGPAFADANAVGAHFAVCSAMLPPSASTQPAVEDYKNMAARLNEIGKTAKQAGLQYAYHNHNMEFRKLDGGKIGYDVLLAETDPALVDFEVDCGWMVAAGFNPPDYFRRYPKRIKMLHIKDFVRGSKVSTSLAKDQRPQGTELGRGYIDYRPILAAAIKIGILSYYVEQEPPFPDMQAIDAAKVDYDYLRALPPFA